MTAERPVSQITLMHELQLLSPAHSVTVAHKQRYVKNI